MNQIDIVMGTYNGSKFLKHQLESIFSQTYPHFHLTIGDDASHDQTVQILEEFQQKYPNKITVFAFKHNAGVLRNFSRLIELSEAPYVMLADQDDIWFPNKVEVTLAKMKRLEKTWGSETPLLIHTDMQVIDESGKLLFPSHWKLQGFNPEKSRVLNSLLMQNSSWGCTMLFNRALCELANPLPDEGFVHDYWLVLVAAALGKIDYICEPTMQFRLHQSNWVGTKTPNFTSFVKYVFKNPDFPNHAELRIMKCIVRAFYLYKRYQFSLSQDKKEILENFIHLKNHSFWKEMYLRSKYHFFYQGFWPNIALLIATIHYGKSPIKYQL